MRSQKITASLRFRQLAVKMGRKKDGSWPVQGAERSHALPVSHSSINSMIDVNNAGLLSNRTGPRIQLFTHARAKHPFALRGRNAPRAGEPRHHIGHDAEAIKSGQQIVLATDIAGGDLLWDCLARKRALGRKSEEHDRHRSRLILTGSSHKLRTA